MKRERERERERKREVIILISMQSIKKYHGHKQKFQLGVIYVA
jgi:hypothetical protein